MNLARKDRYITSRPFALGSLIALMMEAARTSETSVDIQLRTWQYIPEDCELLSTHCFKILLVGTQTDTSADDLTHLPYLAYFP
jgi:hypothetical protein